MKNRMLNFCSASEEKSLRNGVVHNERESEDNVYHCLEEGDPAHTAAETGKSRVVSYASGRPFQHVTTMHQGKYIM